MLKRFPFESIPSVYSSFWTFPSSDNPLEKENFLLDKAYSSWDFLIESKSNILLILCTTTPRASFFETWLILLDAPSEVLLFLSIVFSDGNYIFSSWIYVSFSFKTVLLHDKINFYSFFPILSSIWLLFPYNIFLGV